MLENLKNRVCAANLDLVDKGVVIYTWGNISDILDPESVKLKRQRYSQSLYLSSFPVIFTCFAFSPVR